VGVLSCPTLENGGEEVRLGRRDVSINDIYDDAPWMAQADCRTHEPEVFFPEQGPWMLSEIAEAKRICGGCIVRGECLEYALSNNIEYGVWGGLTRNERKALKKQGWSLTQTV
jgi:WhiB family redox-sensing transcriptional regulator